jgi:hypothetical protein
VYARDALNRGLEAPIDHNAARLDAITWLFMFHICPEPEVPVRLTAFHVESEATGYHVAPT